MPTPKSKSVQDWPLLWGLVSTLAHPLAHPPSHQRFQNKLTLYAKHAPLTSHHFGYLVSRTGMTSVSNYRSFNKSVVILFAKIISIMTRWYFQIQRLPLLNPQSPHPQHRLQQVSWQKAWLHTQQGSLQTSVV
jgi:hypothetical protein